RRVLDVVRAGTVAVRARRLLGLLAVLAAVAAPTLEDDAVVVALLSRLPLLGRRLRDGQLALAGERAVLRDDGDGAGLARRDEHAAVGLRIEINHLGVGGRPLHVLHPVHLRRDL